MRGRFYTLVSDFADRVRGIMLIMFSETENVPMTIYVIADLDSAKGMTMMSNAVAALVSQAPPR